MVNERAVRESEQRFPRAARLLKPEEFTVVFRMRPVRRSEHFVAYARPRAVATVVPGGGTAAQAGNGIALVDAGNASADAGGARAGADLPGRLGLVLGKKFAPRAATRNMMRRALRETFRTRRAAFAGWDVLVRLTLRFDKTRYPGAASPLLKRHCRTEVVALLDQTAQQIGKRRRAEGVC